MMQTKKNWNIYVGQLSEKSMMMSNSRCLMFIHNSRIMRFYKSQWWLLKVWNVRYIIGDVMYLIWPYLHKNWKTYFAFDVDKHIYDSSMNSRRVVIKNAFGSLKNKWRMLKHFNSRVDRATRVVVACYVLHNYCFEWGAFEPSPPNVATFQENLQGFEDKLPTINEEEIAKVEGKKLKFALFEQWLINNPIKESKLFTCITIWPLSSFYLGKQFF
jgi:hypothetical protein